MTDAYLQRHSSQRVQKDRSGFFGTTGKQNVIVVSRTKLSTRPCHHEQKLSEYQRYDGSNSSSGSTTVEEPMFLSHLYNDNGNGADKIDRMASRYTKMRRRIRMTTANNDSQQQSNNTVYPGTEEKWGVVQDISKATGNSITGSLTASPDTSQSHDEAMSFWKFVSTVAAWGKAETRSLPSTTTPKDASKMFLHSINDRVTSSEKEALADSHTRPRAQHALPRNVGNHFALKSGSPPAPNGIQSNMATYTKNKPKTPRNKQDRKGAKLPPVISTTAMTEKILRDQQSLIHGLGRAMIQIPSFVDATIKQKGSSDRADSTSEISEPTIVLYSSREATKGDGQVEQDEEGEEREYVEYNQRQQGNDIRDDVEEGPEVSAYHVHVPDNQSNNSSGQNTQVVHDDLVLLQHPSSKTYDKQSQESDGHQSTGTKHDRNKKISGSLIVNSDTQDRYVGELLIYIGVSGKQCTQPHGRGKIMFGDGSGELHGRWKEGELIQVKSGYATLLDDSGQYTGTFANWKRHGNGTMLMKEGGKYVGGWSKGLKHGFGVLTRPNGTLIYEGMFKHGKPKIVKPSLPRFESNDRLDLDSVYPGSSNRRGRPSLNTSNGVEDQDHLYEELFESRDASKQVGAGPSLPAESHPRRTRDKKLKEVRATSQGGFIEQNRE